MSIVRAENIKKRYIQGKVEVHALRGVSVNIDQGEFVAMAGPSGSGKTTVLNIIGGIDNPDSGQVIVDGNNYSDMTQSKLAELRLNKIGFVFQAYNLIPVLSAEENVEYIMLLQGVSAKERKKKARAILDDVGLEGKYSRRPSELSGGQQQRVAVARAIVSNPAIILADEPTANLDSKTGESLLDMMKKMNREKDVTFIFSTHDNMVMEYAKRIVKLKDGQIENDIIKDK
ncbi:MAG: ABC transporter ATP-binding protein [Deltaproteobacteria bacterium]|jgi:putative ABC transport system ATP-binding protein|nr:ABC transporter ATP-binding protein [Deltaproteobacteria bacterium]